GQRRGQLRQAGVRQGALDRAEHHRPPGPGPARIAEDRGRVLRHLRALWQGDPGPASRGTAVRHTLRGVCLALQLIRRLALPLVIATAVVVADQATMRMAGTLFSDRRVWVIDGFFGFTFHENPAAAFSLFGRGGPFFAVVAILVSAFVIWYLRTPRPMSERIGFGLVLGGALGNLFDRLTRGDG